MTNTVSQGMAPRIARFTKPPAIKVEPNKVFNHIVAIKTVPYQIKANADAISSPASRPGDIHTKMKGLMSAETYASFCNTLQNVGKGKPLPAVKRPVMTAAPATLPRIQPKSTSPHAGTIPMPPPLPALSQSMPELSKSTGWGRVEGATLNDAAAEFKRHYAKKPTVKTVNIADKRQDDMLLQLRDVLKKRFSHE